MQLATGLVQATESGKIQRSQHRWTQPRDSTSMCKGICSRLLPIYTRILQNTCGSDPGMSAASSVLLLEMNSSAMPFWSSGYWEGAQQEVVDSKHCITSAGFKKYQKSAHIGVASAMNSLSSRMALLFARARLETSVMQLQKHLSRALLCIR